MNIIDETRWRMRQAYDHENFDLHDYLRDVLRELERAKVTIEDVTQAATLDEARSRAHFGIRLLLSSDWEPDSQA